MYKHTPKKLQIGVDNISSSSGMDNEVYTNYSSDELGSSDLDASYQEKEPKYPRFKMEELDNNYKFKVGFEFGSLDEFKEAITEWWVAKNVATRMASSDGVKIHDIVSEIRSNYVIGITMNRAWKAKYIGKALVEDVLPPTYKRGPGRLNKLRNKKPDEDYNKRKQNKISTGELSSNTTQEQPQPNESGAITQEQLQPTTSQTDINPDVKMLAANLVA
ncbi:hypothetical protein KIW84_053573 [Lathyrus oleraceus]|uniref:Uncharacterized protein n=1 Tax=Pisum sativum TaxID=3888 RepID=A0A9D4WTC3_PEA|nr:hypothetical protein KIW84_053573 [Pisum sativum]